MSKISLKSVLRELNRRRISFAKRKKYNKNYYTSRIKEIEKIIKYIDSISDKLRGVERGSEQEKRLREDLKKGPIAMFFLWENPSYKTIFEESWSKNMSIEQRLQLIRQLRQSFVGELEKSKKKLSVGFSRGNRNAVFGYDGTSKMEARQNMRRLRDSFDNVARTMSSFRNTLRTASEMVFSDYAPRKNRDDVANAVQKLRQMCDYIERNCTRISKYFDN